MNRTLAQNEANKLLHKIIENQPGLLNDIIAINKTNGRDAGTETGEFITQLFAKLTDMYQQLPD